MSTLQIILYAYIGITFISFILIIHTIISEWRKHGKFEWKWSYFLIGIFSAPLLVSFIIAYPLILLADVYVAGGFKKYKIIAVR